MNRVLSAVRRAVGSPTFAAICETILHLAVFALGALVGTSLAIVIVLGVLR